MKSSRTYEGKEPKRKAKYEKYKHNTWFNTFKVEKGYSDFYILFGVYTDTLEKKKLDKSRKPSKWYKHILLALNEGDMIDFLEHLTKKKENKQDSKFGFGFNVENKIFLTRGSKGKPPEITRFLLKNKLEEIKKRLT